MVTGKNCRYKFFWTGHESGLGGVGFLITETLADKVLSVTRTNHRLMSIRVLVEDKIVHLLSIYAPQTGRAQLEKDSFYNILSDCILAIPSTEYLVVGGDFNGHVGRKATGFNGIHGGHGYGTLNDDGNRILDLCAATSLSITNTFFKKPDSHTITYRSGDTRTQVDYILTRQSNLKHVLNVKVIGSEECVTQHKLLVCDLKIRSQHNMPRKLPPRRRMWRLKQVDVQDSYRNKVRELLNSNEGAQQDMEQGWNVLKSSLLKACDDSCGWTKGGCIKPRETWWWNETVEAAIKDKRKHWKAWQQGGSKEAYITAKRRAKATVYEAKKTAQEKKFQDLESRDGKNYIFKLAKQLKGDNQDIIGEKCVKDDRENLTFSDQDKLEAWKSHYQKLLNEEFPWNPDHLTTPEPVQGPPILIKEEMVAKAIKAMKLGKASGPSGIVAEMIKCAGPCIIPHITALVNNIIKNNEIPSDWNLSYIINCYKGKGDPLLRNNYRGLKLLDQMLKLLERILETIIRTQVNIDAMQFGFMPGRGTTDAIFILRQMQEKHLTKHKNLYCAFVDLEKAFDRVPRVILWWAMRTLGIEEWIVRVTQAMYKHASSAVRVNNTYSEEFEVKVGVHQGSVLSPLLFITVMEALSREFRHGCPWELLYADDLVILADSMEEMMDRLSLWKVNLESKGLKVNMGKTKVLVSSYNTQPQAHTTKWPCGVCNIGVGNNSILCHCCKHWIHRRCSGIQGRIRPDPNFKCKTCRGTNVAATQVIQEVILGGQSLEIVKNFCYLGDMVGQAGGCSDAVSTRVRSAWGKFRDLLPILTNRGIALKTRGHVYNAAVRSVLLYGSQTWPLTNEDCNRLTRNDNSMVRWICSAKLADRRPTKELQKLLGISTLSEVCRSNRLRWYGHLERKEPNDWPRKILDYEVTGSYPRGRPKKRWRDNIQEDLRALRLKPALAQDRDEWRQAIRPNV